MSLFDAIREKASELLSGATEKVGDLPGVQDLSESASDVAGQVGETATDISGQVGETASGVTGSVTDAADTVTGSLPEVPPEYRP